MARFHLVRVGALGVVGRFASVDGTRFPRRTRVVTRTARGLELGEILSPPESDEPHDTADGSILRAATIEDDLLAARLETKREAAYKACAKRTIEEGLDATLMEVEHLFDGRTLVFYFLGEPDPRLDLITRELAEVYDARAQFRRFADAVTVGCGPGCGTELAEGPGCGSCTTGCAAAASCTVHRD